jgi:hypothetical protein
MFTGITNLVSSAISTINNPDAKESYDFDCTYPEKFKEIIGKYMKKFHPENLEKNNIVSCELKETEKKDGIARAKRIIVIDMLKMPFSIPETVLNYFSDSTITVEHLIELDVKNKIMTVTMTNITQPQLTFNETSSFQANKDTTIFKLNASLSVNILLGIDATIRKLWYLQYKSHYEDENFMKKLL